MQPQNENMIKGKWADFKGEVQKVWNKISGEELERAKGDTKAIRNLIQERYGSSQPDYGDQYDTIVKKYADPMQPDPTQPNPNPHRNLNS